MNDHRPLKRGPPPPDPYAALRTILSATGELALDATIHARESIDRNRLEWIDQQLASVCLAVERIVDHLEFEVH
jgi:hypothetical protein